MKKILLTGALAILVGLPAWATDGTWVTNGNGAWNTAANWSSNPTVAGGAGSTVGLTLNIAAIRTVTIDGTSATVGTLNIGDPTTAFFAYTLAASGGASLIMDNSGSGAVINHTATGLLDKITAPVLLNDNLTVNNLAPTAAGNFAINGEITSTGTKNITLNSSGLGTITLTSGNNTGTITNSGSGTGTTTITTVGTSVTGITQASNTSALTVTNALTGLGGTNTFNISKNNIAITGNAGLTLTGGVNNIGTITNDNIGSGTLNLGTVGSNVTAIIQNSTTSALSIPTLNVNSGGTTLTNLLGTKGLNVTTANGTGNLIISNNSALANGVSLGTGNNTGTITNSSTGTGTTPITTVGTNVTGVTQNSTTSLLTITTLNVNSGGTTLTNSLGVKIFTVNNSMVGTGNLILNNNSALQYGLTLTGGANNNGTITNSGSGTGATLIGAIGTNVTGVVQNSANSTLTLSGANTYTADTTVSSGNLRVTGTLGGGDYAGRIINNGSLVTFEPASGTQTLSGVVSGTGAINKLIAASTLILGGNNTYSGGTTLTAGTLGVSHNNALGIGALTLSGTVTLQAVNNDVVLPNDITGGLLAFTVSGTQNLTVNGTFTGTSGTLTNSIGSGKLLTLGNMAIGTGATMQTVNISGTGDTAVIGTIANGPSASVGQAMSVRSTGITTFSGNNTYSAKTGITAGATLVITNVANANVANALGMSPNAAGNLTLTNATLKYTGAAASTDRLFTISGAADGDYATLDASGTGAINFTNTGALAYGTANQTRTLNLTGTNTGNNTLAAPLANNTAATSLSKSGAGTWVLSGNSTYSGATTVTAGTLVISGTGAMNSTSGVAISGSSAKLKYDSSVAMSRSVTVTGGGTFAYNSSGNYTGTLALTDGKLGGTNWNGAQLGGLTIAASQAISPGNSVGTATTTTQTWANSGSYVWEINKGDGIAGDVNGGWDLLTLSGALTISATSGTPFAINITSLGLDNQPGLATGFNSASSYSWLIADAGSAITTFSSDKFILNTTGTFQNAFTGTFAVALGDTGSIGGDSSQLYLTYTAVPEPATWALLAASGTIVMVLRRRRRD